MYQSHGVARLVGAIDDDIGAWLVAISRYHSNCMFDSHGRVLLVELGVFKSV